MTSPSLLNEVRNFRDRRDWTQEDLAQRTGLSRPEISAIETSRLVPSASAALALARAFGCAVESIFHLPHAGAVLGGASARRFATVPGGVG